MGNIGRKIEFAANIAIIIVAIMIGGVLVNNYFFKRDPLAPASIQIGTKAPIPDIDWAKNEKTLILVLQEGCRFCSESGPFYQRLITETASKNIQLVAIFPHSIEIGKRYLDTLKVPISDLKNIPFNIIGVTGTPTLLLVNNEGKVSAKWIGKLPNEKETEVLESLR